MDIKAIRETLGSLDFRFSRINGTWEQWKRGESPDKHVTVEFKEGDDRIFVQVSYLLEESEVVVFVHEFSLFKIRDAITSAKANIHKKISDRVSELLAQQMEIIGL